MTDGTLLAAPAPSASSAVALIDAFAVHPILWDCECGHLLSNGACRRPGDIGRTTCGRCGRGYRVRSTGRGAYRITDLR